MSDRAIEITLLKKKEDGLVANISKELNKFLEETRPLWQPYMKKIYFDQENRKVCILEEDVKDLGAYATFDEFAEDLRRVLMKDYGIEVSKEYADKAALNLDGMLRLVSNS